MRVIPSPAFAIRTRALWRLALGAALSLAVATTAAAQAGQTPPALTPGAPAGSYPLSDLEQVNLFNGSLLLRLRLLELRGRGEGAVTVTLPIEQHWRAEQSDSGFFYPRFNWWRSFKPGYGPGYLQAYRDSEDNGAGNALLLTRMVYSGPDGTEHELRDVPNGVYPDDGQPCVNSLGATCVRGNLWQTRDGSAATFLSDQVITDFSPNLDLYGYLMFRDGTRCRVENSLITEMRDRNGNRFTFSYVTPPQHDDYTYTPGRGPQPLQITDSLNRTVTFTYAQPYHPTNNPVPHDTVTFRGAGGATRTIRVDYKTLAESLAAGQSLSTLATLFPQIGWARPGTFHNPRVVSAVVLPNGRQYTPRYNAYGELAELVLPTGGRIEYTHAGSVPNGASIVRRLAERRVYPDGSTSVKEKTVYGNEQGWPGPLSDDQVVFVDQVDPGNGAVLRQTRHYFYGRASTAFVQPVEIPHWRHGREFRTETYEGATKWRQVDHSWTQDDPSAIRPLNPRIVNTTTLLDTGEESIQFFDYDQYNNRISTIETDYGTGSFGLLVRKTETDYLTHYAPAGAAAIDYDSHLGPHLRDLPRQQRLYAWNGTTWDLASRTTYDYDNYTSDGVHAPLLDYGPSLTGLHPDFDGPHPYRGNVTTTTRMLDVPAGDVTTHARYDITGNVVASVDPRGFVTTFQYAEHFGSPSGNVTDDSTPSELSGGRKTHAFATVVTNLPLGHVTQKQVDYYLGQTVDEQDPNGTVFTTFFNDPLDRPTDFIRANSVAGDLPERNRTRLIYNDTQRFVRTRQDRNGFGDDLQRSEMRYDGLGREIETRTYESEGATAPEDVYIAVQKNYDALGRVRQVSNPFRIRPVNPETAVWTTTTYDGLDRIYDVITPDNQRVESRYSGSQTTVTDQAGKARVSTADALGRVKHVVEAPASLSYETAYTYNPFDQVTSVTQEGVQSAAQHRREFVYDSLSRLRTQRTPEGGLVTFTYDASGNPLSKTDPRVTVNYGAHDSLNRPTTKSYVPSSTPAVTYTYDDPAAGYSKGRLTRVSNSASATDYFGYDRLGRVTQSRQTTGTNQYSFSYGYDLAGNLTSRTYPSGRTVTTAYDRPGRVVSVQRVGVSPFTFAESALYAAHGALTRLRLGTVPGAPQLWENTTAINNRLQPERMGVGSADEALNHFRLDYTYNQGGANNNGNLRSQTIRVGPSALAQNYFYDDVNRLQSASESGGWSQTYQYDEYGNRALTAATGVLPGPLTPLSLGDFDQTKNQIIASDYDGSGNQTIDALGRIFVYDGENRQVSFTPPGQPPVTYAYDGEGRRVSKAQTTAQRVLVYDAFGLLAAEYLTSASTTTGVQYATQDHLGSVRVVTNDLGQVVSRHDYLPFGEEIPGTLGLRPNIFGYSAGDAFRQRFTGKERDSENGLDFFQARYMSSFAGRFTSPDPMAESDEHIADPQNWNRYTYARNNSLKFVDPDGESATLVGAMVGGAVGLTGGLIQGKTGRELWGSAARGAVTGGLLGLVVDSGGTALLGYGGLMAAGALANAAGGAAEGVVSGRGYSVSALGFDLAYGMATGPSGRLGGSESVLTGSAVRPRILDNKAAGDSYRDEVAGLLEQSGRTVTKEVTKKTPFGLRVIDIEVGLNGKTLGGIETKTGKSPYTAAQRAKDWFLENVWNYRVDIVRKPGDP